MEASKCRMCRDIAVVMVGMKAMETAMLNLSTSQTIAINSIAGEERVNRWVNVACVFVGVVSFVAMCMLVYNNARTLLCKVCEMNVMKCS
jgi:hypothetical protein